MKKSWLMLFMIASGCGRPDPIGQIIWQSQEISAQVTHEAYKVQRNGARVVHAVNNMVTEVGGSLNETKRIVNQKIHTIHDEKNNHANVLADFLERQKKRKTGH